jgi:hypothetical protein
VTSCVARRAYDDPRSRRLTSSANRHQEYLPQLWYYVGAEYRTNATNVESSAHYPRNEMIFERVAPSCYLHNLFPVLLEQSASVSEAPDEMPAEDMHRAVLKISEVHTEICETAKRIVACPPRNSRHDKKADGKRADGMSAGG